MIELSTIRDLVAIFGVIAGFSYYVLTVRNNDKIRRKDILFQRISIMDQEWYNNWRRLFSLSADKWKTYDQWIDHIRDNPEDYGFISHVMMLFQSIGSMLKDGVIDSDFVFNIYSPNIVIWTWEKLLPVVENFREEINYPDYFNNFEFLYDVACKKYPSIRRQPEYLRVVNESRIKLGKPPVENKTLT